MVKPSYAVIKDTALTGLYNDLASALAALRGGDSVYERMGQGARSSEKLAEIVAVCRRHNNSSVNPGAQLLAAKVLELAGEREGGK